MKRAHATLALILFPAFGYSQDMPLFTIVKSGETWKPAPGERPKTPSPLEATSPDGSVKFSGVKLDRCVHAFNVAGESTVLPTGGPYAQLRIEPSYDNDKKAQAKRKSDPPMLAVTSLLVDSTGRIYAATKLGVQIFDPTGRLCGVLGLPTPGDPEHLSFEGSAKDQLGMWIGDKKFTREMKATGK